MKWEDIPNIQWYGERGIVNAVVTYINQNQKDRIDRLKKFLGAIEWWGNKAKNDWISKINEKTEFKIVVELGLSDFGSPDLIIVCMVNNEKYCGKKMLIKQDYYCSYHMHKIKEETFYILEGELEVIHKGEHLKVKSGDTLHILPGEYHSFRALKDTTFFEFSTQHLDEDNYRLTKSGQGNSEQWKTEIETLKND